MSGRFAPRALAVWLCLLASCALIAGCQEAAVPKTAAPAAAPAPAPAPAPAATATGGPVTFAGGNGSSIAEAILVKGATEVTGVAAEYQWLNDHLPGFRTQQQALLEVGGRHYDQLDGVMPNGERRSVIFDITEFFGKI
jgi:hypothetical protein